MCGEG